MHIARKLQDLARGIMKFNEPEESVIHYCSNFAEVISAEGSGVIEDLRGWVIKGVEVFRAGTWRGINYTEDDVQTIVDNFYSLKGTLDPVFKVNHSEDAKDQMGWILDVRKSGDLLLADIHVTEWEAYDKITNGTWKKVSAEIYLPERAEAEFQLNSHVLRAVAVVSIPQVKGIKGIVLNAEAWDPEHSPGKNKKGGRFKMDWDKLFQSLAEAGIKLTDEQKEAMKAKGVEAFGEITAPANTDPANTDPSNTDPANTDPANTDPATGQSFVINAEQLVSLSEKITALTGEKDQIATQLSELLSKDAKRDNESWVNGLIQEGKVLPAEKESILSLAEKLDKDGLAAYKETFKTRAKIVDFGEHGGADPDHSEDETKETHAAFSEQFKQKTYE